MSEHDLQRLMAKQEVKQEAAHWTLITAVVRENRQHVEKPEPEQTRPAEPGVAEARGQDQTRESPQWKRAERYIKKHYPDGTDGVSTPAIHRKFKKDKDLQAELEKEGGTWGVPSAAVINRVLGRRESNPADFWACPGMPNDAQTQAAHKL